LLRHIYPLTFFFQKSADRIANGFLRLNLIILRLANVYGPYDSKFIAKGLCMARVYQELKEELKWLWTKDLRINTVHISDAVRAIWSAADWASHGKPGWDATLGATPIFNIVDKGDTSQGTLADVIKEIFAIETGFQGSLISTFAKLNLDSVVDDVNDHTLQPWADLLADAKITRPGPLSPFMEKELLKDADHCLDGSRFEEIVGFKYEKPMFGKVEVEEMIDSYKRMNWWP
jgi:nucleoside-diphosphate-sugar epimerase